jgi:hypothetical protein
MAMILCFPILMFAACGGSSGTGTAGSTVNISLASAVPNAAPNDAGTPSAWPAAAVPKAAVPAADNIDHVWITVHRVSLIGGNNAPGPDPNGEMAVQDMSPPDAAGHISADLEVPEEIDLLDLPSGGLARFLAAIDNVPAGTYGKVRLYYSDPKVHFLGAADNTVMHGTANFHLDIHFSGGKLVIPVSTGGGVQIYDVSVVFVPGKEGLKITAGPNNILMRPQVFASASTVRYMLIGTADNVDKTSSTFDLATEGGRIFQVAYDPAATNWSFRESGESPRAVAIDNDAFAIAAFNDNAIVSAIGSFSPGGLFLADDVTITFPVTRAGTVASGTPASGWLAGDTFVLDLSNDNVVIPMPSRETARYDDNTTLSPLAIGQAAIVQGAVVTARGYDVPGVPGGTEAYWVSVGP